MLDGNGVIAYITDNNHVETIRAPLAGVFGELFPAFGCRPVDKNTITCFKSFGALKLQRHIAALAVFGQFQLFADRPSAGEGNSRPYIRHLPGIVKARINNDGNFRLAFFPVPVFGNTFQYVPAVRNSSYGISPGHGKGEGVSRMPAPVPRTNNRIVDAHGHFRQSGRLAVHFKPCVSSHPAARRRIVESHAAAGDRITENQTALLTTFAPDNHIVATDRHRAVHIIDTLTQQHGTTTHLACGPARFRKSFGIVGVIVSLGAKILDRCNRFNFRNPALYATFCPVRIYNTIRADHIGGSKPGFLVRLYFVLPFPGRCVYRPGCGFSIG